MTAPIIEAPPVVTLELTPKQEQFLIAALSGTYRYLALGGAIRGTKTFAAIACLLILCRLFPGSRWAIVRQDLPTLRRNTIPSIEKIRDTMGGWLGDLNQGTWTYQCANGSELMLVSESLAQDPDLNRFKGFEVNGFLLEEGNELARKTFHKAIERAGAWVIPATPEQRQRGEMPEQPPPLIFITFNPSSEWTDEVFHEPFEHGTLAPPYFFLPLTIRDNPYLTAEYLASLEELRQAAPEEYARFVLGKRGAVTLPNQLIPANWLVDARTVAHVPGPTREAVDVARYGDDDTVFATIEGNALADLEAHSKWDTNQTSQRARIRLTERRISADDYVVDTVGLGAGVADNMRTAGMPVRAFVAGASPIDRETKGADGRKAPSLWKFANLRSQAWWEFREKVRTGRFRLAPPPGMKAIVPELMRKLVQDLTAVRYEVDGERTISVWSKDKIMKIIGRSTDYGDAVVMAAFDFPPVPTRSLTGFPIIQR
jgi:phage terminase large subunit